MNTAIEIAASLVECCIYVKLCNGFIGFKSENGKWIKTTALFAMVALVLIIFLLIALSNVLLYIHMRKMQRNNKVKEENKLLKSKISAQERLATETMERYTEIRTLKHDMKHYLTIAAELISNGKSEEAKSYIESVLNEKIAPSGTIVNTGSAVVDAVINNKISLCSEKRISVKCVIDTQFECANDVDISILLSNLLDNAINGCDLSNPHIELVISKVKSMICIAVKNSIAESVLLNDPELKTDKQNKSEHGFGVKSIRQIAARYDGSIKFREEGGMFIAEVWLKN